MIAEAEAILADAPHTTPAEIVAVGGTASNLLKVVPGAGIDLVLTRARIAEAMDILERETAAEAVERHLVKPIRASDPAGRRGDHGCAADAVRGRRGSACRTPGSARARSWSWITSGAAWRDRLPDLAHGWRA